MGRITDYPEITALSDGDYLIVDNIEGGTKKVSAQLVAGTIDPIPTEDSQNAVRSDGVYNAFTALSENIEETQDSVYRSYPNTILQSHNGFVVVDDAAKDIPLFQTKCSIFPNMTGSGMPSINNVRTISAKTDLTIYKSNKNLIPTYKYQASPEKVLLGVASEDGLIFLKEGTYTLSVKMYDETLTVIPYWKNGEEIVHESSYTLTKDSYVSIYLYDENGIATNSIKSFQLEIGSESSSYIKHEGEIVSIQIPTDHGEIYYGFLDVAIGVAYMYGVMYSRNSATMNNSEDKPGWSYTGLRTLSTNIKVGTFDTAHYNDRHTELLFTQVNVGSVYSVEYENNDYTIILPVEAYGLTQSQWISLGIDIQILVSFNGTYQFDFPSQEIRTFLGNNIFYIDTGDVSIGYRKDADTMYKELKGVVTPFNFLIRIDPVEGYVINQKYRDLMDAITRGSHVWIMLGSYKFRLLSYSYNSFSTFGYYEGRFIRILITYSSDTDTWTVTVIDSDVAVTKDSILTALGYDVNDDLVDTDWANAIASDVFSTEIAKPTFLATDNMSKSVIQNAFGIDAPIVAPSTIESTTVLINRLNPRTWFVWLNGAEVEFSRLGVSLNATNNAITLYLHGRTSMCTGIMGVDNAWTVTTL